MKRVKKQGPPDSLNKPRKYYNILLASTTLLHISLTLLCSFGASLEDIDDFMGKYGDPSDNTFAAWVADQVDSTVVPVTSHREFYRRHTNPRWDRVSWSARPTKSPCDQYARWRTIPLISRDSVRNSFSVTPLPRDSTKWIIQIDGEPRTVVSSIEMEEGAPALVVNTAYAMCNPDREFWQEAVVSLLRCDCKYINTLYLCLLLLLLLLFLIASWLLFVVAAAPIYE